MSEMLFKSIIIADVSKKTARYHEFKRGFNVITSHDNHVGKSSLLKSLYHAMGASVHFDNHWDTTSKIYIVDFIVNNANYRIVRFQKNFALFSQEKLILLTSHITKDLAPELEKIFSFSVYLPGKDNKSIQLTPPALSFLPYYIDQDKGWSDLYGSFENLEQFSKADRNKSLLYHLQVYTKSTVEKMAWRDALKIELEGLKGKELEIKNTIQALCSETSGLVPAIDIEELNENLELPKAEIEATVSVMGTERNTIQRLEASIQQQLHHLQVVKEYKEISNSSKEDTSIYKCPRCGYNFDEELYREVRKNYRLSNEDYMIQQIEYMLSQLKLEKEDHEGKYVELSKKLSSLEHVYDESQDAYDLYVKRKGLEEAIRKFNSDVTENIILQHDKEEEIKAINKELRQLPNKKTTEETYIGNVKSNMVQLQAWDSSYEDKLKLLKPIAGQGSLASKIILAQSIGLFQTMDEVANDVIRFPFVVDSPKTNEASVASGKDIMSLIGSIKNLPQVILATIDFREYEDNNYKPAKITDLNENRKLLNDNDYNDHQELITDMYELLKNMK